MYKYFTVSVQINLAVQWSWSKTLTTGLQSLKIDCTLSFMKQQHFRGKKIQKTAHPSCRLIWQINARAQQPVCRGSLTWCKSSQTWYSSTDFLRTKNKAQTILHYRATVKTYLCSIFQHVLKHRFRYWERHLEKFVFLQMRDAKRVLGNSASLSLSRTGYPRGEITPWFKQT